MPQAARAMAHRNKFVTASILEEKLTQFASSPQAVNVSVRACVRPKNVFQKKRDRLTASNISTAAPFADEGARHVNAMRAARFSDTPADCSERSERAATARPWRSPGPPALRLSSMLLACCSEGPRHSGTLTPRTTRGM